MQVRDHGYAAPEFWEQVVSGCEGHGLHMPAIYRADHDASRIHCLSVDQDGQPVACVVLVDPARGRFGWLRRQPRTMLFPVAPALRTGAPADEVRQLLLGYVSGLGAERLQVSPGYGQNWVTEDRWAAWRTHGLTEFVIRLDQDHDAVLAGMHKIHRKNIRRAQRSDLEVQEDHSVAALLRLRDLQLASAGRAGERTESFAVQDEETFRRLHQEVYGPGLGRLIFARLDGVDVAALAWVQAAGRILTVRSGSLPLGYESRAMYLLHDELIRRAFRDGVVEVNIGGVPVEASDAAHPQSGLYEFKLGFGGTPVTRYGLDLPLGEIPT